MRNKVLHRRLVAVEAEFDRAAKAMERSRVAGMKICPEEAERVYRRFKEAAAKQRPSKELENMNVHELIALYQRRVQTPSPKWRSHDGGNPHRALSRRH
jgi:uncharacterized membrane protein YcjF (UPF0283 family)